ncbi:MAG: cysteine--tRNA ligase [Chloroflexi bacterium]|nr:cysteine--tRNA ligase [Chloroflexota bacterium]MDA1241142.1 cysteine--tRNA ligase [Chloroflexota bacterium]MQC19317.1 cysteine--tRNA ligase [Chloroflexota bacterium]
MRLTNTLTGSVEPLEPVNPGHVGLYVCGVTPYAAAHVGHAMSLMVYDVLARYLRWRGLEVTVVSNYTDVDDKLIERAAEQGIDPLALANANIEAWEREQDLLGMVQPDVRPRVTQEIPNIIAMIEEIIANGFAYASQAGDVYYRVRAKDDYGKLSHRDIDQLRQGTRFDPAEGKEFALDFALWKATRPGEPAWESPWGPGRPGWHIECSAMARRYLGETFDIHGGGLDLVFPHHENEIAQAEAAAPGRVDIFARVWMHNGMVQRDGEKMSKSLGNVVNVEDALAKWSPDAIRLFVLGSHYRSPNNLTDEALAAAVAGVERLIGALRPGTGTAPSTLDAEATRARFIEAMEDDLGTAQALAALFDLARAINRARDAGETIEAAQAVLHDLAGVLGLSLQEQDASALLDAVALSKLAARLEVVCGGTDVESTVGALIERRTAARTERDFALSDRIRDELATLGVVLEDGPQGTRWSAKR